MPRPLNPDKLYQGGPCRNCGGTLRWKACHRCYACKHADRDGWNDDYGYVRRRRSQLRNLRRKTEQQLADLRRETA